MDQASARAVITESGGIRSLSFLSTYEMKPTSDLIDFTELVSSVTGEGLEQLVRHIGIRKGLSPSTVGRGSDRGRDLFFTEILSGSVSNQKIKWLVFCRDKATSNKAVSEDELPHIQEKLTQHKADGFLLVTTTAAGAAAQAMLEGLDKGSGGPIYTMIWDKSDLTTFLLQTQNYDLVAQFFPQSYKRVRGLTSLEGALLAYKDELPESVLSEVLRIVKPYSVYKLKGSTIWPYDAASAETIDKIIGKLIIDDDLTAAVACTDKIAVDAFTFALLKLDTYYHDQCYKYVLSISMNHGNPDLRFNAIQFLLDHYAYRISDGDYHKMTLGLDRESTQELLALRVTKFVEEEIFENQFGYDIGHDLDSLSSATIIDEVLIEDLEIAAESDGRISFHGTLRVGVTLHANDDEGGFHDGYPGEFEGYIDDGGISLTSATVDVSSFYK